MPIYEYRCSPCGRVFEALQRVSDPPVRTCGQCGGEARRIVSAPAIQFVGSGWYVTDYARKEAKSGAGGNGDGPGPGAASSGKTGDARPASPKEPGKKAAAAGSKAESAST